VSACPNLSGRRVGLRPLTPDDFGSWKAVRRHNVEWLELWEPRRSPDGTDPVGDRRAFAMRCSARERERQLGTGWGFGIFLGPALIGEINLSNVVRGAFQNAHVGYWVDRDHAGRGYTPEALVVVARFAFETSAYIVCRSQSSPVTGPPAGWWRSWTSAVKDWPSATWRSTGSGRTIFGTPSRSRSGGPGPGNFRLTGWIEGTASRRFGFSPRS